MGARHQAFVIARVRPHGDASLPPRYRCIAAYHHQWCYGTLPLRAVHRFITIVKQKDNAEIVAADIAAMHGLYGRSGEAPEMPDIPAPFVAFLLATSWSVDMQNPEEPYASSVSFENNIESAGMGTYEDDNDDGITIIDVTDPTSPSYCFNDIGGPPLTAVEYVSHYYPLREDGTPVDKAPADLLPTIAALKDVNVVTAGMLHEAWPSEYPQADVDEPVDSGPATSSALPSMQDMTLAVALSRALDTGETSGLEEWMWRSDLSSVVRTTLRKRVPFPENGIPLLKSVIEHEVKETQGLLDLSGFALSSDRIVQLTTPGDGLEVLKLSDNPAVTADVVPRILTAHPDLQRLVLLGCPSISDAEMYALLAAQPALFYRIGALIHPAFLKVGGRAAYPNALSFIAYDPSHHHLFSRPYFTLPGLVQALTVFLAPLCGAHGGFHAHTILGSALVPPHVLCAAPLAPGQAWRARSVAVVPRFSTRALAGEGWAFCFRAAGWVGGARSAYGFVKFAGARRGAAAGGDAPTQPCMEILDLRAFLARMAADGRPAPPEDDVRRLEGLMQAFKDDLVDVRGLPLLDEAELAKFAREKRWLRTMY